MSTVSFVEVIKVAAKARAEREAAAERFFKERRQELRQAAREADRHNDYSGRQPRRTIEWTPELLAIVGECRAQKMSWKQIAVKMSVILGRECSADSVNTVYLKRCV